MLKAQKLESLGVLAGGIAHDFNNLLTSIVGNISLAGYHRQNPEMVAQLLSEAESAAVQAKSLTQQLLTFAKGGEPVKKIIRMGDLIRDAVGFATRGSQSGASFPFLRTSGRLRRTKGNCARSSTTWRSMRCRPCRMVGS